MNTHKYSPEPDENEIDALIDAALNAHSLAPLPAGFVQSVMENIAQEPGHKPEPKSALSHISRARLHQLLQALRGELNSVRNQLQSADVILAFVFALLWCAVGGAFVWTDRLISTDRVAASHVDPLMGMTPLFIVFGGLLTLGMLGVFLYLEQRDV